MKEFYELLLSISVVVVALYPVWFLIEFTTSVWRTNKASHAANKPLGLQPGR